MSTVPYKTNIPTPSQLAGLRSCGCDEITLNHYTVTRIVYQIIKLYLLNNKPCDVGVVLNQKFDADPAKSDILLDIGYNWRTRDMSKVPAIFVQRGELNFKAPTMGQGLRGDIQMGSETRDVFCTMPVIVTCVAAEPVAVVEQLAEYVKQPLLYFRRDIQLNYGIRHFVLSQITAPKLLREGKNNFYVDLNINVTFDDNWVISKEQLKIKSIGVDLFDLINEELQSLIV